MPRLQALSRWNLPREIAKVLNRDGVPGPAGAQWGPSTINGNAQRGTGLLNNELYVLGRELACELLEQVGLQQP